MEDVFVICLGQRHVIINVEWLKTQPFIQQHDARIFRWLTGLENHPIMKPNTQSLEQQFVDFFSNFDIRRNEWLMFVRYLQAPSQFTDTCECRRLTEICLNMGIYVEIRPAAKTGNYNPTTPETDCRNLYQWEVSTHGMAPEDGWSVTVHTGQVPGMFYYRRISPPSL